MNPPAPPPCEQALASQALVLQALALQALALQAQLQPMLPGLQVQTALSVASTNSALLEAARAARGLPAQDSGLRRASVESRAFGPRETALAPCLLVALTQTGGRGRLGRAWQSAPGASLTCSLRAPLSGVALSGLSLAVGVALCEALDPSPRREGAPALGLKWPNDLWLIDPDGSARKLGGILIETVWALGVCQVVVGVGLNVVPFDAADLDSGFAALCELDPQASLSGALDRVAPALVHALRQFEREGYAAFAARYAARDALRGRNVTAQVAAPGGSLGVIHGGLQEEVHGVAHGVADDGCLRVRTARGEVRVHSGEVRVRVHA